MIEIPPFYEADALERIAINLFYGWGYNFYRHENKLRSDDQLVRSRVGALLGSARASVAAAEGAYRRSFMPPPSRAQPRPEAQTVAGAQRLEQLSAAIGALAGRVQAQPVPENDRMTQRIRTEAATLAALILCDQRIAAQAEMVRGMLEGQSGAWMIAHAEAIDDGLAALSASLKSRAAVLLP